MATTEEKVKIAEERVAAILLQYPGNLAFIRLKLQSDYFKGVPFRSIYDTCCAYFEKNGVAPSPAILKDMLARRHPDQADPYGTLVDRLLGLTLATDEIKHVGHYIEGLRTFHTERAIKTAVGSILENLEKENVQAAAEVFSRGLPQTGDDLVTGKVYPDAQQHLIEQEYRSQHPELYGGIRMGFDNIDRFTGGHFRKELGVAVAGTGIGKSLLLGQTAVNVARQGHRTVLVTIENDKQSYMNRLYSNLTEIPFHDFKTNRVTTPELVEKFFNAIGQLRKDFYLDVVEFPNGCSPNDIWFYLRHLPYEIDYLVVDQISNMMPNNPDKFKPDSWQAYGHIALEMKRMIGLIYNGKGIPCLTAMQATGGTGEKRELTTDDIAMSKQIIRHAHFALYITKIEEVYTLGASKYRDARLEPFTVYPEFKYWQLLERPHREVHASLPAGAVPPGHTVVVNDPPTPTAALPPSPQSEPSQPFPEEEHHDPAAAAQAPESPATPGPEDEEL